MDSSAPIDFCCYAGEAVDHEGQTTHSNLVGLPRRPTCVASLVLILALEEYRSDSILACSSGCRDVQNQQLPTMPQGERTKPWNRRVPLRLDKTRYSRWGRRKMFRTCPWGIWTRCVDEYRSESHTNWLCSPAINLVEIFVSWNVLRCRNSVCTKVKMEKRQRVGQGYDGNNDSRLSMHDIFSSTIRFRSLTSFCSRVIFFDRRKKYGNYCVLKSEYLPVLGDSVKRRVVAL